MSKLGFQPTRRGLIGGIAAAGTLAARPAASAQSNCETSYGPSKTFVFAHGSWHGGWCWKRVTGRLTAQGHRCFAPSYSGMGDRAHLLSKDITINTFIDDLTGLIQAEELSDVILVAHSFGGIPVLGAADRIPDKIQHLVFLDSNLLESGQTAFSSYPQKDVDQRIAAAEAANGGLAVPAPIKLSPVWGFAEGSADYDWVMRRLTPHPLRSYQTPLILKNPIGNNLPRTYVHCYGPENPVIEPSRKLLKTLPGWTWIDFNGPHESMITHADKFTEILTSV